MQYRKSARNATDWNDVAHIHRPIALPAAVSTGLHSDSRP